MAGEADHHGEVRMAVLVCGHQRGEHVQQQGHTHILLYDTSQEQLKENRESNLNILSSLSLLHFLFLNLPLQLTEDQADI